ncbi:hypothetical protein N0V82_003836 [Gnomoniopsis sp. IMI 355080]|nr:hypothetical protein N0V82_003836 [Gnomoniopsis sp. IMI 355080]
MQNDCDLFANPPDKDYVCAPQYCKPIPDYYNNTWATNQTGFYQITEGYFNLNPNAFGLSFDIFSKEIIVEAVNGKTSTLTTGNWASQTSLTSFSESSATAARSSIDSESTLTAEVWWKRGPSITRKLLKVRQSGLDSGDLPALCLSNCNQAFYEAQKLGKSSELCGSDSAFTTLLNGCNACIETNGASSKITDRARYIANEHRSSCRRVWYVFPGHLDTSIGLHGFSGHSHTVHKLGIEFERNELRKPFIDLSDDIELIIVLVDACFQLG